MSQAKKVLQVYKHGSSHWVGDGFPVRNLIPSSGLEKEIDPFLLLDYAGPTDFLPSIKPRGVGEHPHRGFETVSLAYRGSVEHRDSSGSTGIIHPGDVQWMTAGSGVVHEEMHEAEFAKRGGTLEMIQLWVNLPRVHKMTSPRYQTIKDSDIPRIDLGSNSYARVISGKLNNVEGPAETFTPVNIIDVRLTSNSARFELPKKFNTAVFLLRGSILICDQSIDGEAQLALLDQEGDELTVTTETESRILILSAKPINEPVVSSGPFVMNTKAELVQAFTDYQSGRMGHLPNKS